MLLITGFILTGCAEAGNNDFDSMETPVQATSSMEVGSPTKDENTVSINISVIDEGN